MDLTKEETLYSITQDNTPKLTLVEDLDSTLYKRKDTIFITPPNPCKKPKTAPLANKILKILELKILVVISLIENNQEEDNDGFLTTSSLLDLKFKSVPCNLNDQKDLLIIFKLIEALNSLSLKS